MAREEARASRLVMCTQDCLRDHETTGFAWSVPGAKLRLDAGVALLPNLGRWRLSSIGTGERFLLRGRRAVLDSWLREGTVEEVLSNLRAFPWTVPTPVCGGSVARAEWHFGTLACPPAT